MGMMDNMTDKMSGMGDDAMARFNELRDKQKNGELTDQERDEYNQLREHMSSRGNE